MNIGGEIYTKNRKPFKKKIFLNSQTNDWVSWNFVAMFYEHFINITVSLQGLCMQHMGDTVLYWQFRLGAMLGICAFLGFTIYQDIQLHFLSVRSKRLYAPIMLVIIGTTFVHYGCVLVCAFNMDKGMPCLQRKTG